MTRSSFRHHTRVVLCLVVALAASRGVLPAQEPPPTLRRAWNVPGHAVGSPATDDTSAYFLSGTHEVVAIDASSGAVRWQRPTGQSGFGSTGATVLVAGSVVVAGDDNLVAFDRRTGHERWRFVPADGYGPGFYMGFAAGEAGVVFAGSPSGHIYAVDAETGRLRWSTEVANDGKTTVFPPRRHGELLAAGYTDFVAPNRGGLVLLATQTGRILWKQSFPLPEDRSLSVNWAGGPVFADNLVIVSSGDGVIRAYDVTTGRERWSIPPVSVPPGTLIDPQRDFRGLAVSGRLLISGSLTGIVTAFDLESREERWRYVADKLGSVIFRLDATEDVVYVPFAGGTLLALDAKNGVQRWRLGDWTTGNLWPPVRWQDRLIVSGAGDGLSAYHVE